MADNGSILVTGAAGQLGAVGRTVTGLLLDRGLPVRAMVRREDDRAAALRAAGAEVVVGDLLEPADVARVVSGCRRVYFEMSVSGNSCRFMRISWAIVDPRLEWLRKGAILALVSETMIPEAFHGSPQFNGLLVVVGFVALLILLALSH
jgi:NAD(P)-dependent dehydrogenase (short-subunit alcohol dehydrogenase family)